VVNTEKQGGELNVPISRKNSGSWLKKGDGLGKINSLLLTLNEGASRFLTPRGLYKLLIKLIKSAKIPVSS